MGRDHTFMDREFGRPDYDPDDQGEFERGLVFVVMPFQGQDMTEAYAAINRSLAQEVSDEFEFSNGVKGYVFSGILRDDPSK